MSTMIGAIVAIQRELIALGGDAVTR